MDSHTPDGWRGIASDPLSGRRYASYTQTKKRAAPVVDRGTGNFLAYMNTIRVLPTTGAVGYLAIAPGSISARRLMISPYTLLSGLVAKVPDSQVLAGTDHVASWASRTRRGRIVITGFLLGGRITGARAQPRLKAAVAWYTAPKLVGDITPVAEATVDTPPLQS